MWRSGKQPFWRTFQRRFCAGFALFAYLIVTVGFPLPVRSARSGGQPFICQNHHGCGCRNAEECWSHCCCFSVEERLTWASDNHIEPPAYAELPSRSSSIQPAGEVPEDEATGWRTTPKRACKEEGSEASSCCAARETTPPANSASSCCHPARASGTTWALGVSALRCRLGVGGTWISPAAQSLPPIPLGWTPYLTIPLWFRPADVFGDGRSVLPLDPPPRSASF